MQTRLHTHQSLNFSREEEHSSTSHEIYFKRHSEKEIWSSFKSGSEVALINIYKYFYRPLFRYGSQFTKDRELIQDAIQDLFAELLKRRNKLSDTSSIKFYLFKSLKTTILSLLKQIDKYPSINTSEQGLEFGMSLSQETLMILGQIEKERQEKLKIALDQLGKRKREILYYYYFEGLTISEIASLMDFSNEKSAQNLLYKSLNSIKNKLMIISVLCIYSHFF